MKSKINITKRNVTLGLCSAVALSSLPVGVFAETQDENTVNINEVENSSNESMEDDFPETQVQDEIENNVESDSLENSDTTDTTDADTSNQDDSQTSENNDDVSDDLENSDDSDNSDDTDDSDNSDDTIAENQENFLAQQNRNPAKTESEVVSNNTSNSKGNVLSKDEMVNSIENESYNSKDLIASLSADMFTMNELISVLSDDDIMAISGDYSVMALEENGVVYQVSEVYDADGDIYIYSIESVNIYDSENLKEIIMLGELDSEFLKKIQIDGTPIYSTFSNSSFEGHSVSVDFTGEISYPGTQIETIIINDGENINVSSVTLEDTTAKDVSISGANISNVSLSENVENLTVNTGIEVSELTLTGLGVSNINISSNRDVYADDESFQTALSGAVSALTIDIGTCLMYFKGDIEYINIELYDNISTLIITETMTGLGINNVSLLTASGKGLDNIKLGALADSSLKQEIIVNSCANGLLSVDAANMTDITIPANVRVLDTNAVSFNGTVNTDNGATITDIKGTNVTNTPGDNTFTVGAGGAGGSDAVIIESGTISEATYEPGNGVVYTIKETATYVSSDSSAAYNPADDKIEYEITANFDTSKLETITEFELLGSLDLDKIVKEKGNENIFDNFYSKDFSTNTDEKVNYSNIIANNTLTLTGTDALTSVVVDTNITDGALEVIVKNCEDDGANDKLTITSLSAGSASNALGKVTIPSHLNALALNLAGTEKEIEVTVEGADSLTITPTTGSVTTGTANPATLKTNTSGKVDVTIEATVVEGITHTIDGIAYTVVESLNGSVYEYTATAVVDDTSGTKITLLAELDSSILKTISDSNSAGNVFDNENIVSDNSSAEVTFNEEEATTLTATNPDIHTINVIDAQNSLGIDTIVFHTVATGNSGILTVDAPEVTTVTIGASGADNLVITTKENELTANNFTDIKLTTEALTSEFTLNANSVETFTIPSNIKTLNLTENIVTGGIVATINGTGVVITDSGDGTSGGGGVSSNSSEGTDPVSYATTNTFNIAGSTVASTGTPLKIYIDASAAKVPVNQTVSYTSDGVKYSIVETATDETDTATFNYVITASFVTDKNTVDHLIILDELNLNSISSKLDSSGVFKNPSLSSTPESVDISSLHTTNSLSYGGSILESITVPTEITKVNVSDSTNNITIKGSNVIGVSVPNNLLGLTLNTKPSSGVTVTATSGDDFETFSLTTASATAGALIYNTFAPTSYLVTTDSTSSAILELSVVSDSVVGPDLEASFEITFSYGGFKYTIKATLDISSAKNMYSVNSITEEPKYIYEATALIDNNTISNVSDIVLAGNVSDFANNTGLKNAFETALTNEQASSPEDTSSQLATAFGSLATGGEIDFSEVTNNDNTTLDLGNAGENVNSITILAPEITVIDLRTSEVSGQIDITSPAVEKIIVDGTMQATDFVVETSASSFVLEDDEESASTTIKNVIINGSNLNNVTVPSTTNTVTINTGKDVTLDANGADLSSVTLKDNTTGTLTLVGLKENSTVDVVMPNGNIVTEQVGSGGSLDLEIQTGENLSSATLSYSSANTNMGTIITTLPNGSTVEEDTTYLFTAYPYNGYRFTNWVASEGITILSNSTSETISIRIDDVSDISNLTLTANFSRITSSSGNSSSSSSSGSSGSGGTSSGSSSGGSSSGSGSGSSASVGSAGSSAGSTGSTGTTTTTPNTDTTPNTGTTGTTGSTGTTGTTTTTPTYSFSNLTDVSNHWANNDIKFMVDNGYLVGMSEYTFEPNTTMSTAMFITVLNRIDADGLSNLTSNSETWFGGAEEWVTELGLDASIPESIISNMDNGISREAMSTLLYNYINTMDLTLPSTIPAVNFTDGGTISSWSAEAIAVMQKAGIISGRTDGSFDPLGTATRAEVSSMLKRFVELVK